MPDKVKVLYDALSGEYDLGSFDEFKTKMSDQTKRKALYDAAGKDYELGTFDEFNKKMSPSGPIPAAQSPTQTLPTFQEQLPTMQANRFDEAVSKDKKKSGSYIGALYDSFVSAVDPLMYIGDEAFLGAYQYMSGKKLAPQEKQAIRKAVGTTMEIAGARPRKTQDEGVVESIQSGWDLYDGFGSKDLKALGLMGSRVVGDLAIAAASTALGVPAGSTYFAQGYGSGLQDYNDMVAKGSLEENGLAKQTYALTVGTINGLLEKLAFDKIFGTGPAFDAVKKRVTADVLKQVAKSNTKVTMDVVEKVGEQMLKKELSTIGRRTSKALYAAGVESLTEGTQAGLEDAAKLLTNAVQNKQVFDEEDIKKNFFKNIINSGAAGFAIGGPMGISSTMMSNVDNTLVKEIANAKDETELNSIISELEESMAKSNASEEEIDAMRQSAVKYNSIKQTIPATISDEAKSNIISLIDRRNGIDEKMSNWQAELEMVDESMKPDVEAEVTTLTDAKELINDEIRENASGGKFTYTEDKGKYFKQFEGEDPIEIKKSTYELKKTIQDATKKSEEPVQESSAVSDISEPKGTQEVEDQKTDEANVGYRYIIGEEGDDIPVTALLNKKVRIKGQPAIIYQQGQTVEARIIGTNRIIEIGNVNKLMNELPETFGIETDEILVTETPRGFRVEGQDMVNDNETPTDAINYDKNGKVMNVVLKTTAGKRRKFRGQVAQDLAYQIQLKEILKDEEQFEAFLESEHAQELENARVQAAAQAEAAPVDATVSQQETAEPTAQPTEPTARPTAEPSVTTEPAFGKIVADQPNKIPSGLNRLQRKVVKDALRVVDSIIRPVQDLTGNKPVVNLHNKATFTEAVLAAGGQQQDADSRGFYLGTDGTIHLNMDNLASDTMLHEGFHPILDFLERYNPEVINNLFTQLESIEGAAPIIAQARANYDGDVTQKKEAITDFVAGVADGRIVVNPTNFDVIRKFILDMLNKIGIGKSDLQLMDIENEADLIELANFVTENFREGNYISRAELESFVINDNYADSGNQGVVAASGRISEDGIQQSKVSNTNPLQFSKPQTFEGVELVKLPVKSMEDVYNEFGGRATAINSDPTKVGKLKMTSGKEIFMYGGPNYTALKPNVDGNIGFASTRIEKPNQVSKILNTLFPDRNGEGVVLVTTQAPESMLGNAYSLEYTLDAVSELPKSILRTSQFKNEFFGKDIVEIKNAFGEKEYAEFIKKFRGADMTNPDVMNDMIQTLLTDIGNNFMARNALVSNMLAGIVKKSTRAGMKDQPGYISKDPNKFIAKQLLERFGLNQEKLFYEIGENGIVKEFMDNGNWGFVTNGFLSDGKIVPTDIQENGIIHPQFNAKFYGKDPFILDGGYLIDKLFLPENIITAKGKPYTKKASLMVAGSMYPKGPIERVETPDVKGVPQFQRVAPNGQPSKLNAKQYEQVRTPEFKAWFGDWEANPESASKAVDENGEPLVLFHGTKAKFDQFEYNKMSWESRLSQQGPGFYMTDNKKAASQYGKPMNVFTSVKNPLVVDNRSSNITKEQAYKLFSNGDNKWFYESYLPFYTKSEGLSKEQLIKKYVDDMSGVRGFDKEVLQNIKRSYNQETSYDKMMSDVAGILGKDGVIEKVSDSLSVYVAFTPNQIKSATANVGTFSTQDDRIQFQKQTPTKETRKPVKVAGTTVISSKAKAKIDHLFTSAGPLGPAIRTFKDQMGGELTAEVKTAEKLTNQATELIQKYKGVITTQDVENFLSGNMTDAELPLDLASKLSEMRTHIDKLTDRIIDLGVIEDKESRQLYLNNRGKYMLRSYELFTVKGGPVTVENVVKKLKNVDQAKLDAALKFLEEKIKKDSPELTDAEIKQEAISQANFHLSDEDMKFGGRPIEGAVNTKSITRRSELLEEAPAIRALMGEFTDPIYKYYGSIFKLANIASHRDYLNKLREEGMGKFLFKSPTGEATVQIDAKKTKGLKPIGELYTFPEIKEALTLAENEKANVYSKIAGILRKSKTVYNPATHVGNILGSFAFSIVNGHWMYIGKTFNYLKKGNRQKLDALLDVLRREGVLNNNVGTGEIKQYFNKFEDVESMLASINDTSKKYTISGTYGKTKKFLSDRKRDINKIPRAMEKAYAWEDDIFKILGFVSEANLYSVAEYGKEFEDLEPQQRVEIIKHASELVKSNYPTFSRVPTFVKKLSKVYALGDFLSFPVEAVRTSYNTLSQARKEMKSKNPKIKAIGRNRLVGTIIYNGMIRVIQIYGLMALGQGLSGMVGYLFDDEEEIKKRNYAKMYKAPWNKESVDIRTQFSDGKLVYVDIGARDPYKYQREVWSTFWSNLSDKEGFFKSMAKTLGKAVIPFISPDMAATTFLNLLNNKDEFGEKIVNPENPSFKSNAMDVGGYILKRVSPGAVNSMYKMYNFHNQGDAEGVNSEILNQLARTYEVPLEKAFIRYVYATPGEKNTGDTGFKERLDIAEDIYREVKNSKYVSDAEKEQRYQMALDGYKNVLRDIHGYYEAAKAGGVDAGKLNTILYNAKLGNNRGKYEMLSIIHGNYDYPDEAYIRR
jgi:hypothetical protein